MRADISFVSLNTENLHIAETTEKIKFSTKICRIISTNIATKVNEIFKIIILITMLILSGVTAVIGGDRESAGGF